MSTYQIDNFGATNAPPNKALQLTENSLHGFSAAELDRYVHAR